MSNTQSKALLITVLLAVTVGIAVLAVLFLDRPWSFVASGIGGMIAGYIAAGIWISKWN